MATIAAPVSNEAVTGPRLAPIAWTWNPLHWLAIGIYRSIGAPRPAEVMFSRAPLLFVAHFLMVLTSEYALSLDRRVRALVRVHGSRTNGCAFCDTLETRLAIRSGAISRDDADALAEWTTSDKFTERERAALRYVQEIDTVRSASDETFANLRLHFPEREIIELTWLNAVGNYLNLQARPLGLASEESCSILAERTRTASQSALAR